MPDSHAADTPPTGSNDADAPRADIEAEIADHLASAEAELRRGGLAPERARSLALDRFGDVDGTVRQCWWVQEGEEIMNRAIAVALTAAVVIAVAALAFAGWRMQQTLASRMDHLSEQLAALAKVQESLLSQQAQTLPVRVTGRAYLGNPDRPVADYTVSLRNALDGKNVRILPTDSQGRFDSGPLPTGAYTVSAPMLDTDGQPTKYTRTSRPCYLYEGGQRAELHVDLLSTGRLRVTLPGEIPNRIETDRGSIELIVELQTSVASSPSEPIKVSGRRAAVAKVGRITGTNRLQARPSEFPWEIALPAGRHKLFFTLRLIGYMPMSGDHPAGQPGERGGPVPRLPLLIGARPNTAEREFEVSDGKTTELRVQLPKDLVSRLRELASSWPRSVQELRGYKPEIKIALAPMVSQTDQRD